MNWARIWEYTSQRVPRLALQHVEIVLLTLLIAVAIALPLAIWLTRPRFRKYTNLTIGGINVLQCIPSLGLLAFVMPLLGIGMKPALLALVFLSLMPIAKNSIAGLDGVDRNTVEAAFGMGMSPSQVLWQVEIPLAMPVIMTGIRTSTVLAVSSGVLASAIGAGGLGDLIMLGLFSNITEALVVGGVACAIFASICDTIMGRISLRFVPPGMTLER